MATTRSLIGSEIIPDALRSFFHQKRDQLRRSLAHRKVFRKTYYELSMLSDRDLADLGIPRSNIRRLAQEAADVE
ncbi:MAG: DUF1127 domain-containing protein [Paracoccaceae bacterium]